MQIHPGDVVEWGQHPLTRILIMMVGGTVISFLIAISVAIWAVIKWIHPRIEDGIVTRANEPLNNHIEESQEIKAEVDTKIAILDQKHDAILTDVREIKATVEKVRDEQWRQSGMIVGLTASFEEFRKSMNTNGAKRHHAARSRATDTEGEGA